MRAAPTAAAGGLLLSLLLSLPLSLLPAGPVLASTRSPARSPSVVSCSPSDLSATTDLTPIGVASTSLAGAVLLRNTSPRPCSLRGVPTVRVLNSSGQQIPVYEEPSLPRRVPSVTLGGTAAAASRQAGSSITWSKWLCGKGTFTLTVRFAGWARSLTAPWGSAGAPGASCTSTGATLYVSTVERTTPAR